MNMEARRRNLPSDERRAVTVRAVVDLAAERNPGDITTQAIAQRMRLTQGALFRHFPNKDAIWEATMGWVAERLLARVDRAAESSVSPLAALEAMFMTHVEFVVEHPGVPRMLFSELQRPGDTGAKRMVRGLIGHYAEHLREIIEQGKTQREIAPDVDTAAAATLFIGTIQGLVMQSLLADDVQRIRTDAPGVFTVFQRGIRRSART